MADTYIDPQETQIYGRFAREQLAEVCKGRVPALDPAVDFAIQRQEQADLAMKAILDQHPAPPLVEPGQALEEARDVVVRFGAFLQSLKGRPLDLATFFGKDVPSVLARRRLTKLVGGLGRVSEEAARQAQGFPALASWAAELAAAHDVLRALEKQQRAKRAERAEAGPEVEAARQAWLDVYGANKHLARGVLAHAGRPELLPLIFDDLAEQHRVVGVTDEVPQGQVEEPEAPKPAG